MEKSIGAGSIGLRQEVGRGEVWYALANRYEAKPPCVIRLNTPAEKERTP
jgi:hypothetical protein